MILAGRYFNCVRFAILDVPLGLRPSFEVFADPNNQATVPWYGPLYFGLGLSSEPPRGFAELNYERTTRHPGLNGPDLQDRLLADGYRIPIVFVTGTFDEAIRTRVLRAGALGYFSKPCSENALIDCLNGALGSSSSWADLPVQVRFAADDSGQ